MFKHDPTELILALAFPNDPRFPNAPLPLPPNIMQKVTGLQHHAPVAPNAPNTHLPAATTSPDA